LRRLFTAQANAAEIEIFGSEGLPTHRPCSSWESEIRKGIPRQPSAALRPRSGCTE
jgi:hypothetical protein